VVNSIAAKKAMVDKTHPKLSIRQQCILLGMSRNNLYYSPSYESQENEIIMRFLDEQYYKTPFYGLRKLTKLLQQQGYKINPKRVRRLMQKVNWHTIYRAPNTSAKNQAHKIYPYLLRNIEITTANQVWSTDITYIPMQRGYMYLCAIIDVHTKYIVNWSLSNTMTSEWCLNTIENAIEQYGVPQIVNTDQGSQFTSEIYTQYLKSKEIKISMDGKGRATDNVWIERLWRSVKYEDIYLKNYTNVTALNLGLTQYFKFYNNERIHENLNYSTPHHKYKIAA
jgi:putative transposase